MLWVTGYSFAPVINWEVSILQEFFFVNFFALNYFFFIVSRKIQRQDSWACIELRSFISFVFYSVLRVVQVIISPVHKFFFLISEVEFPDFDSALLIFSLVFDIWKVYVIAIWCCKLSVQNVVPFLLLIDQQLIKNLFYFRRAFFLFYNFQNDQ